MKNMGFLRVGFLVLTGLAFVHGAVPQFSNANNMRDNLVERLQNMKENFPANVVFGRLICEDGDGDAVSIRIDLGASYVKIDRFGQVSLVNTLDSETFNVDKQENRRKINFICEETQTSNRQRTILEAFLVVIDVNDNTPYFDKEDNDNYYVVIREDTPPGTMIYDNINVVDLDGTRNNIVVAICESECDTFEVTSKLRAGAGEYKFEIRTKKTVTEKNLYLLKINARDAPVSANETVNYSNNTQNVVITVQDIQNLPPDFEYRPLSFSLSEDQQPGTKVGIKYIGAFDQDVGDPNYIRLELRADPSDTHNTFEDGLFGLRPAGSIGVENKVVWQADLMLNDTIDRESIVDPAKTLRLTIVAIEYPPPGMENRTDRNPMTATETLEITILDVNDERPEFNEESYEIVFNERERIEDEFNYREISINYDIFVTDTDGQKYNVFNISIVAGNDDNAFRLNRYEGAGQQDITVLARDGILDYDNLANLEERTIVLRATDRDNPSLFSEAVFVLRLIDVNDNPPVFTQATWSFPINEDFYLQPYFVGQVVAEDADKGEFGNIVGYSFSGNFSSKFSINDNGEIYVQGDINYEGETSYLMTVTAVDSREIANRQTGDATVLVVVNNVPDIGPRFTRDQYETFVTEHLTTLVPEIRVVAEDPEGISAVRYSVNSTIPPLPGYFVFPDPFDGLLILTQGIDYQQTITADQKDIIRVLVQACTQALSTELCTLTTVIVTVRDQNNYAPEFLPSNYYETTLSELANPGEVVLKVSTYDKDIETDPTSNNAKVRYQIARGNRDDFHIRINSGEIIVSNDANLDVDDYERYEITVVARDFGDPGKSSFATVVIILEDANNKDPEFTETTYFLNVFENATIGTDIPPPVKANDPDRDAIIKYDLDFSNLIVELEGSRTAQPDYRLAAQEALGINHDTGMIRTAALLDRTKYEVINFGVIARDVNIDETKQQPQTATASVMLFILGIAETNPYFIAQGKKKYDSIIRISRPESGQIDWALYYLYAFDPLLSQAITRYEIIEGTDRDEYFELDGRIVRVKQVIDYDTLVGPKQLSVGVRAISDDGTRYVDATLQIDVTDVNDNNPKFAIRSYQFYVSESSTYGKSVGSVYATDIDSGTYGEIEYFIEGERSQDFIIRKSAEERMATIYVSRDANLDFETYPRYTLTVIAIDNPGPDKLSNERLRGNADLEILVEDENDNNPIFEQEVYELEVVGTKPVFEEIDVVLATDKDRGRNGDILYSASELSSPDATFYFGVDTQYKGSLTMGRIFVRSSLRSLPDNSVYTLIVVAMDNGISEVRTGTALVHITVSKGVRDPKPKWDPGLKSKVTVLESEKKGYSVAYITAKPANATSRVQYNFITQGDAEGDSSMFNIDPNTGHVTLAAQLDYETKSTYNLLIQASDVGNLTLTNQFLLTVLVEDVDDNLPSFTACPLVEYPIPVTVPIKEDVEIPTLVYTAVACDRDSFRYNRVRYSWHFDDRAEYGDKAYCRQEETDPFRLDEETGDIYANETLDREVKDSHLLCVTVEPYYPVGRRKRDMVEDLQDRTNHNTTLYVLVTVLDANDKGPIFDLETDRRVILESPPARTSIYVAKAYDDDLYPNNEIRYTIDRILFTKGGKSYQAPTAFNINTRDGSLTIGAYDRSFTDYVGGYFTIDIRAADARGEIPDESTMTLTVYVGHSSEQIRVIFQRRADSEVEEEARQMVAELNGLKEAGVYYEIMSFGPHQISNVEDPDFERTDVCLMIIKDNRAMSSLDAVKRLSDVKAVRDVLNKYGAIEPGPCEPARSVYPEGWESYWWVLVAFAIFIFVITIILIIIVVFLHRSYKNYMDSHKTYLVSGN